MEINLSSELKLNWAKQIKLQNKIYYILFRWTELRRLIIKINNVLLFCYFFKDSFKNFVWFGLIGFKVNQMIYIMS